MAEHAIVFRELHMHVLHKDIRTERRTHKYTFKYNLYVCISVYISVYSRGSCRVKRLPLRCACHSVLTLLNKLKPAAFYTPCETCRAALASCQHFMQFLTHIVLCCSIKYEKSISDSLQHPNRSIKRICCLPLTHTCR